MLEKINKSPSLFVILLLILGVTVNILLAIFSPPTPFWTGMGLLGSATTISISLFPMVASRRWAIKCIPFLWKNTKAVELIDFRGESYISIAKLDDQYRLLASVYWFNNIGQCILKPDGRVDPRSDASYVYFWMPLDKTDRVEHLLRNEIPDLSRFKDLDEKEKGAIIANAYNGGT